jgi:hypothetical protein
MGRAFNYPVGGILGFKPAFIANPVFYLTPFILSCGYPVYLITPAPERGLTFAFGAVPVGIYGFEKPYPVLKPEGLVGKCPNGAYVNHISDKIVIERFLNIGSDF